MDHPPQGPHDGLPPQGPPQGPPPPGPPQGYPSGPYQQGPPPQAPGQPAYVHPQGGHPYTPGQQPPYGPGQPPYGPGQPQGQNGGMSTGAKIGLIGGAAVLALVLVGGTIVALSMGGDDAPVAADEEDAGEDDGGGDETDESEGGAAAGSGPGTEVFEGSRNELIELDEPQTEPRLMTIESESTVTVELRDTEGDQVDQVYSSFEEGARSPYNLRMNEVQIAQLDVRSEAESWTITDEPLENAETWDDPDEPLEGSGPDVFLVDWDTADVEVEAEHSGELNFIVWAGDTRGYSDLLINEIGDYSGTESFSEDATVLEVESDGDWSLTASL